MRLGTVLAAALVVMGGCAGSGERANSGSDEREADLAASMEVKVSSSSVRLILHVTNDTDEPIRLTFPTSQRYDFIVETRSGEEVWRWSEGMAFLQAISEATLAPGDSWDMDAVWDPESRTGEYIATGLLTARDRELRQSTAFELR